MSRTLTVNNITFNYPENAQDPGWGEEASAWAEAVTDVLGTLLAPGDILVTTATIADNQSSVANVNGLAFDPAVTRATNVYYSIYRTSTDTPSGNSENGVLYLTYDNNASAGNKWILGQNKNGESGVVFSVTDSGQVQYVSSQINAGAGGYSGTLKFSARTLGV